MKTALLGAGIVPVPVSGTGVTIIDSGGYYTGVTLEEILAEIGAGTAPGAYLRTTLGGVGNVQALGNLGATETIDLVNGNYFWGTLDQDCTIGFTGWTNLKDCWIVVELIENGTGGWTPTFSGVTWEGNGGAVPVHPTTAGTFTRYIFHSRDGGTTIVGGQAGADTGLTIEDEGVALATAATSIDFVGPGVVASGTGAAKTVTISAAVALDDLTDVTITSAALADRLRFDGTVWRNSALIWRPVTVFDPTTGNYLPLVDGSGNQIMAEA